MYRRFVDNGKLAVLTSARRENGFPPKCKTSTGNKFDFRSPSPSQKSALLKVANNYAPALFDILEKRYFAVLIVMLICFNNSLCEFRLQIDWITSLTVSIIH